MKNVAENKLFVQARSGHHQPAYWRAIVYWLASVFTAQTVSAPFVFVALVVIIMQGRLDLGALQQDPYALLNIDFTYLLSPDWGYLIALPAFLTFWAVTYIFVRLWEDRPFHTIGLRTAAPWRKLGRGMGLGLAMFALSVGLSAVWGFIRFERLGGAGDSPLSLVGWMLLALAFFAVQASAEEVQFRGYLLPVLGARGGGWVGILGSAFIFGLSHGLNPHVTGVAVCNIVLVGLFLALYTLWEEGLWGVFGWHAAWNWAQGNLFGLEVSGQKGLATHPLLDLTEIGPDWITGGSFGPEGGTAVTIVMLIGLAFLGWRLWTESQSVVK